MTQLKGELKTRDDTIHSLQSEVTELQTRVEDLEQHGHRDSVQVFGIPEDESGSTDDKVLRLFNKRLKLDPPLDLDDIAISHRVGQPKEPAAGDAARDGDDEPEPPRALLVKFVSRSTRERVMGTRKKLKEPVSPQVEDNTEDADIPTWTKVFITDDLTKARAKLAYQARVLKRNRSILDTWVINCKIMAKDKFGRISKIKSTDEILHLIEKSKSQ